MSRARARPVKRPTRLRTERASIDVLLSEVKVRCMRKKRRSRAINLLSTQKKISPTNQTRFEEDEFVVFRTEFDSQKSYAL